MVDDTPPEPGAVAGDDEASTSFGSGVGAACEVAEQAEDAANRVREHGRGGVPGSQRGPAQRVSSSAGSAGPSFHPEAVVAGAISRRPCGPSSMAHPRDYAASCASRGGAGCS